MDRNGLISRPSNKQSKAVGWKGNEKRMGNLMAYCHERYKRSNYRDRTMLVSVGAFGVNALIGGGKLILGIALLSPWFVVTAIYYLLLCSARGQLLWRFKHIQRVENPTERFDQQFAVFRHSGIFICLLGISYLMVCARMYFWGESSTYPYYIVYGVAGVAFYKIGMSIYGIVVSRRIKNPLLTTMKVIAFMDACVSIVAVQCALLTMEDSAVEATRSSALLGGSCSIVFVGIGVYMLLRRKVYPGSQEFEKFQ